jgi:uncharacterized protein
MSMKKGTIWIDMDNSPHVPFFRPIIDELERRGYSLVLTTRKAFQVCELADMYGLNYEAIGSHSGKNVLLKVAGLILRAFQLLRRIGFEEKPVCAVSHGSRAQILAAKVLRVPSISMDDYEHSREIADPTWLLMPDVIPEALLKKATNGVFRYPGIKEDVYVPFFTPDPSVKEILGLKPSDLLVTVRPPAIEAHYHHPLSQTLFKESMIYILAQGRTRVVVLPRSDVQKTEIEQTWQKEIADRKIIIPQKAVDGLSLIWYSDLVISAGGTMNREAAALGVPVYSIFKGTIGAVDRYLASVARLTLIETIDDVRNKIALVHRGQADVEPAHKSAALERIVAFIDTVAKGEMPSKSNVV